MAKDAKATGVDVVTGDTIVEALSARVARLDPKGECAIGKALLADGQYNPLTAPPRRMQGSTHGFLNTFLIDASDNLIAGKAAVENDYAEWAVDARFTYRVYLTDDTKRDANKGTLVWASVGAVVADIADTAASIEWVGNGEAPTFKDAAINFARNVGREAGARNYALTVGDATSRSSVVARFRKEAVLAASALFDEGSEEFNAAVEKITAKRLAAHEAEKAAKEAKENRKPVDAEAVAADGPPATDAFAEAKEAAVAALETAS